MNEALKSHEPADAGSLARFVRGIVPVTVAVVSWIVLGLALIVLSGLLLICLIPMSPFLLICLALEAREPVVVWWGEQFEKGTRIISPNGKDQV